MGVVDINKHEPAPTPNGSTPVWELVIEDMRERDKFGRAKYKTPLQAHNGRNSLIDAYQETLDLCVYLRGAIEEQKYTSGCPECGGQLFGEVVDGGVCPQTGHHDTGTLARCTVCGAVHEGDDIRCLEA